jgi:predicted nucleic acid-binding protein
MTFLLDTNVVSEWVKPQPNPSVVAWLADVDEDRTFISVITLAELRSGIAALAPGRRRDRLESWLAHDLPTRFEGRVLLIDAAVADGWGRITASAKTTGRSIHAMDAFSSGDRTRPSVDLGNPQRLGLRRRGNAGALPVVGAVTSIYRPARYRT